MNDAIALDAAGLGNPAALDKKTLAAMLKYLGALTEVDVAVANRVAHYVVDGTDEAVLLTLGGLKGAAAALGLGPATATMHWEQIQHLAAARAALFRLGARAAPGPWVRLAHVFDAVERATGAVAVSAPGSPGWLRALLGQAIAAWHIHVEKSARTQWSLETLQQVLEEAGLPADLLARMLLDAQGMRTVSQFGAYYHLDPVAALTDWPAYLARHVPAVRAVLTRPEADARLHALDVLRRAQFDFTPVLDVLIALATGPAKTIRDRALPLLQEQPEAARPLLDKVLAEGDAAQRHEAAQVLWRLFGAAAADQLRAHAAQESSGRVRQTIDKLVAAPAEQAAEASADLAASLPPVPIELGEVALSATAKAELQGYFDRAHEQLQRNHEKLLEQWNGPNRPKWMREPPKPTRIPTDLFEELVTWVEGKGTFSATKHQYLHAFSLWNRPLGDWLAPPDVQLIHVVRLAFALQFLQVNAHGLGWHHNADLEAYRARCTEPFGLRALDAAVATLPGGGPGLVARAYIANNTGYQTFCDWEPAAIWPIFAEHPDVLRTVLAPSPNTRGNYADRDYSWSTKRHNAFRVLAMFPRLPPGYVSLLWDLALGESKADRPRAQAALATVPDKAPQILVALADGRQAVRSAAAEWLGKIGDRAAIESLKGAFRKEKQEAVKGALLGALEALGADVQEFMSRSALGAEADAGLAKKLPRGLDWVPLDRLPALHWEDTGAAVDPQVVRWWVVQSIQQKSPVCSPLLRRYLAMCRKHESAALAKFLLAAWIAQDTRLPPHEEAAALAQAGTDKRLSMYSQHEYFKVHYKDNKDNLYRELLPTFANQFLGSAIDQKGLLALVAAAGDADCVKLCEQYIRKWFGNRLAQCKALVEVLAWIRHPLAIQALLGFATRFRTKAVRQGAEQHVQALAEREGWTLDELADRTIPDAGFARPTDADGQPIGDHAALTLDYGGRTFTVTLGDDLQPVVATAEGKAVKSPPAPGKSDDLEKAEAAKKAFTDAKKAVKEIVKRQGERLYEALCTQRSWACDDWKRYLADHPIVGRLCVRLVWSAFVPGDGDTPERFLGCFRPMEDGSLTNEQDAAVVLAAGTLVRLAHTGNTPAGLGEAWLKHCADYDVEPPFAQFGRPTYTLPADKQKETDVKDFEGHAVTTFKLRGKATKLGFIRGEAEDGGCFVTYRKPFPSLGLQAVIGFTGSALPEQDMPAALMELSFTSIQGDRETVHSWQPSKLPLSKVPAVLLSECYNDLKQIAAEGPGFDPKWQERSYF